MGYDFNEVHDSLPSNENTPVENDGSVESECRDSLDRVGLVVVAFAFGADVAIAVDVVLTVAEVWGVARPIGGAFRSTARPLKQDDFSDNHRATRS